MSLNKAIAHGKEKRKPYRGIQQFEKSSRCHGGCDLALSNRIHKYNKKLKKMEDAYEEAVYQRADEGPH